MRPLVGGLWLVFGFGRVDGHIGCVIGDVGLVCPFYSCRLGHSTINMLIANNNSNS